MTAEEPSATYGTKTNVEKKVIQVQEKIKEHRTIVELANEKNIQEVVLHHLEIIKLLKEQINLLTIANANKIKSDEILNSFDQEE